MVIPKTKFGRRIILTGKENYGLIASMMLGAGKQLAYMSRWASHLGHHSGLGGEIESTGTPNPNLGC